MKAKLIINGKELEVDITEAELKKLEEKPKKTGYERVTAKDSTYYFDNGGGYVGDSYDPYPESDGNNAYKAANYYTSKEVAVNNVRADKLMRQLRRFAVEHREKELDWHNDSQNKYYIEFDGEDGDFFIESCQLFHTCGAIYFDTAATADLALDTFHNELIWYFTEYKDSL